MLLSGLLDLSWWQLTLVALLFTHITIAGVTIYLHRHQAHRGLDLHPIVSHFFRFWLWLTTGMVTKEWVAIHRKHHARCETAEDPHSPQIHGINRVLWGGVLLYAKETHNKETMERFSHGTPDDWVERNVYTGKQDVGVALMALINIALFGFIPGLLIWATQMLWIPFWAAGVINGWAHYRGYRTFQTEDASRNIIPWGIIIGGEELHNNHHAFPTSAKLKSRWYEIDIGWTYIQILSLFGLADVKRVAPKPVLVAPKGSCDEATLQAVITHRYEVLARFAGSLKQTCADELGKLRERVHVPTDVGARLKHLLHLDSAKLPAGAQAALQQVLKSSNVLHTIYTMRQELGQLWARSNLTREQLVKQLEDWCRRAENSNIAALQDFSRTLRSYA